MLGQVVLREPFLAAQTQTTCCLKARDFGLGYQQVLAREGVMVGGKGLILRYVQVKGEARQIYL